jgi:DNA helicase-2/ATP-dependent DNA helicase PcrA
LIENGVNPSQILILTFTRKASSEIVERVYSEIPSEEKIIGSTFHGWCNMILFKNSKYFNVRDYTVIDRDDQESIFKLIVAEIDEKFKELKLKVESVLIFIHMGEIQKIIL